MLLGLVDYFPRVQYVVWVELSATIGLLVVVMSK
jgi:hypothetical protein